LKMSGTSYRLDETYMKVGREWKYFTVRLTPPAVLLSLC
jgi:transposase-like protein